MEQIDSITKLIAIYKKLPGIGSKTAERLAYATLSFSDEEIEEFVSSLKYVNEHVHSCPKCGMKIDTDKCPICDDPTRDESTLLVLIDAKNILTFEKTNKYNGKYFVLGNTLSPLKGRGPNDIRINELKDLVSKGTIKEVILACSSTLDGELTASYIHKTLSEFPVKITRLAYGLPIGADLEYVDELTIERSLRGRLDMKEGD